MEEQIKMLAEQMKSIQEQLDQLQQKTKEESTPKELLRPSANPALILTAEMNFDVWDRMITGELAALKYNDLLLEPIDKDGKINYDPEDEATKGRIHFVSTFLLARVDDTYKTSLCDIKLPYEMLARIREMRFPNLMSMRMTLERQWANIVMSDAEDVLKFTNRYQDATKRLLSSGVKLEPERIVGNYCIAMKNRFPECSRRFDVQNNITMKEMTQLAMNIESTERESKARIEESNPNASVLTATVSTANQSVSVKKIVCFRCGKPNHTAKECTNPRWICYNCGKLGSHSSKECTAPPVQFPFGARFPSGRIEKPSLRGSFRGRLSHGNNRRGFGSRGRNFRNPGQQKENTYKKVKMTGVDGKEKFVMLSEADGHVFELPESNYTNVSPADDWGTNE